MPAPSPAESAPSRRARREAERLLREVRRQGWRHRKRLGAEARLALQDGALDLEAALRAGDAGRVEEASRALSQLWEAHLSFTRKGLLREYLESIGIAVAVALLLRTFVVEAFQIPSGSMVPTLLVGDHIFVSKLAYGVRLPLLDRVVLRSAPPRRGDVIVFANPREKGKDYIKRVVGLPGDVVELRDQVLYVNGVAQPRTPQGDLTYDEQSEQTGSWWSDTCLAFEEELSRAPLARPAAAVAGPPPPPAAPAPDAGVVRHEVLQCRRARPGEREGPFRQVAPGHLFVLGDNRDRSADSRSEGGWEVPLDNVKGRASLVWWSWGRGGLWPTGDEGVRIERLFKRIE
ncbi:signal peptidase I [Anaeromyxobacter paludicola]|uniref:Signal peptidase I n=1 Tax=Anaeromyxobacter paludicola TaxID=2918171 RepID=A0ABN6N3H2_9BACT|nr:signal peptidase I [Anaeromyxobacter paludicola]BDG07742.1 hypothetical protein AMPC_08550 [Anaeromyxobacter paludicola]